MRVNLSRVANRIRSELTELEQVLVRVEEGWNRTENSGDDYYLDGVALNLHGFYSGLERIFGVIAINVDGGKPVGENWHQELLRQMSVEIAGLRPAVLSKSSYETLNEYRGFRHVVRNIYTYNFDPEKMRALIQNASKTFKQVRKEMLAFADFLQQAG